MSEPELSALLLIVDEVLERENTFDRNALESRMNGKDQLSVHQIYQDFAVQSTDRSSPSVCGTKDTTPVGFRVTANDGFYAQMPWKDGDMAMLEFNTLADGGRSLRLRVPQDWNACLNVKNIVKLEILRKMPTLERVFGNSTE